MQHHEISICQDQLIFVSQRPRYIFYQAEKSLSSRRNMGTMLDIFRRPVVLPLRNRVC